MFQMTAFFVSLKKTPQINDELEIAALDDFALKKRHRYGTILINAVTHKVVDMIESREKDDVIKWLKNRSLRSYPIYRLTYWLYVYVFEGRVRKMIVGH